jgi:hypothetical protein
LFDEQGDSLDAHNMDDILEDVQECMNIFVDMHGKEDKPIIAISFKNVLKIEEIELLLQSSVKDEFISFISSNFVSSVKDEFISFISSNFGFIFFFQLPSFTFVC